MVVNIYNLSFRFFKIRFEIKTFAKGILDCVSTYFVPYACAYPTFLSVAEHFRFHEIINVLIKISHSLCWIESILVPGGWLKWYVIMNLIIECHLLTDWNITIGLLGYHTIESEISAKTRLSVWQFYWKTIVVIEHTYAYAHTYTHIYRCKNCAVLITWCTIFLA